MELVGNEPNVMHATVHWGPQGQNFSFSNGGSKAIGGKFSDEFHVFSLVWVENKLEFFMNDELYHTITPSVVNGNYPFNEAFFFIFNVAVGGNWPGNPDATTVFPQRMIVDYVRVFQ